MVMSTKLFSEIKVYIQYIYLKSLNLRSNCTTFLYCRAYLADFRKDGNDWGAFPPSLLTPAKPHPKYGFSLRRRIKRSVFWTLSNIDPSWYLPAQS